MIKTGGRNCYGNTCCTILFLVVWEVYWYMVARHFIALETRYRHKNPTVKGLRSYDQGRFMAWQKSGRVFVYVNQGQSK